MSMGTISAIVAIAGTAYGAYSSNRAAKKARQAQEAAAKEQQAALQGLYNEQPDPFETFKEIFLAFPGLLEKTLPSLRRQSSDSAKFFTKENVGIWDETLSSMYPDYKKQEARRLGIINEMDPANMGQEEIKAQTRMLGPLIPEGTLNPSTGAVHGGTQSPVSMYRNFISGMYQDRRNQFNANNNAWLDYASNSAARQQVKSEALLPSFLNAASGAATSLTPQIIEQSQSNIAAQTAMLQSVLGSPVQQDNSAAIIASGAQSLAGIYANYGTANNSGTNPYKYKSTGTQTYNGQIKSLSDRPYVGKSSSLT